MRPDEFMVGDFVFYEYTRSIVKIVEIGVNHIVAIPIKEGYDEGTYKLNIIGVSKIPITTEFLEKNGFVKQEMYYRTPVSADNLYLEFYQHEGRLRRIYVHKNGSEELAFTVEGISYVHTLQHALRLCGIEKEIVL